jgi:hypothetical protein
MFPSSLIETCDQVFIAAGLLVAVHMMHHIVSGPEQIHSNLAVSSGRDSGTDKSRSKRCGSLQVNPGSFRRCPRRILTGSSDCNCRDVLLNLNLPTAKPEVICVRHRFRSFFSRKLPASNSTLKNIQLAKAANVKNFWWWVKSVDL